jgi:hypothetical protein
MELNRIIGLQQRQLAKTITEEEQDELDEFYRSQAREANSALKKQLEDEAKPRIAMMSQLQAQHKTLEKKPNVQTLLELLKERGKLTKRIAQQSKKDACKAWISKEKDSKEAKKELNAVQKKYREAGGGRLPGFPERKRGGKKKTEDTKKRAPKRARDYSESSGSDDSDGDEELQSSPVKIKLASEGC